MTFSILFSIMSCMYSYKLKIEESVKNDVEIDTIDNDNDDEKESIEVSENMTQYPTIPFKFCKIKSFKNIIPHWKKNRIWNRDPQPHLTSFL